ncbi:MAG: sugar transferase [Actinobacteria bacterium]|nr:sugar transferase [Actinomycetota bacterium]
MSEIAVREQERRPSRSASLPGGTGLVLSGFDGRTGTPAPLAAERSLLKRGFELVVAVAMLILLLPLMALVALLIRLDSPGPIFFRCRRVGYRGHDLDMLKFRKMHDRATGAQLTLQADDRFTRVGKWLARLKLDELPQLWHVIRGEMSLIGPRPEDHDFVARFPRAYAEITRVRPGIMGLSQLAFAGESAILDPHAPLDHYLHEILPQKLHLDRLYAERWNIWLDIRIALWTAVAVLLRREVAVDRNSGEMGLRRR